MSVAVCAPDVVSQSGMVEREGRVNRAKCATCGLINFGVDEICRRCGAPLNAANGEDSVASHHRAPNIAHAQRTILSRFVVVCTLTGFILIVWYLSLVASSRPLTYDQKKTVGKAIDVLERQGFDRDVFVLRRLVNFRASDNWWNKFVGHADAYAATNFPFEVVTLYPDFFTKSVDDVERAAVLLHESYHLAGRGEETAFAGVWRGKNQLGWTRERYGHTRVWGNVAELTSRYAPKLFRCGDEGNEDCTE
ncbi:MAG TPA: hypothetical protein VM943_04950 [Pyrinomonadaceae bacterium]|nr:hypothetical protein [Pyrinomonadaceae bacterium]